MNESRTDQGVTVTFTDLFYDGSMLSLGYTVKIPAEKDVWSEMHYRRPHINGPTMINDVILDYSIGNEPVKIGDHLYAGILSIFPRAPLPDSFDLELEAPSVGVIGGSGKWKWQLPVTLMQRLKEAQRTIHPQVKLEWNGLKISVEEVQVSQSGTDLVVLASGPTEKLTKLDFTGMDEHMTLIDGGLRYSDKVDEQTYRYQLRFLISPKRNSFLNLIPGFGYTVKESTSQEFRYDLQGAYPISLPKENGGALVTRVDFMSDKTVVHYQVQDPFQQLQFLMIEDEKGTRLPSNHVYPIRESTESFSFRYEFPPVNPQQKVKLLTTVNTTTLEENVSNYEGTPDMRRTQIKIPL